MPTPKTVRIAITSIMLVAFLYCELVPLLLRNAIPSSFASLAQEVFETFAPPLTVMLGCMFARRVAIRSKSNVAPRAGQAEDVLALVIVGAYCLVFVFFMTEFLLGIQDTRATDAISLFRQYRSMGAFLLTGIVAFYFSPGRS